MAMMGLIVGIVLLILAALIFTLLIAGWVYLDAKEQVINAKIQV